MHLLSLLTVPPVYAEFKTQPWLFKRKKKNNKKKAPLTASHIIADNNQQGVKWLSPPLNSVICDFFKIQHKRDHPTNHFHVLLKAYLDLKVEEFPS